MRSDGKNSDCSNPSEERKEYQTQSVYNHCGKLPISLSGEHLLEQARAMLIAHKLHNIIELWHTTKLQQIKDKKFAFVCWLQISVFTSMLEDSSSSLILSVITLISFRIAPSSLWRPDNWDLGDFLGLTSPFGMSPLDLSSRPRSFSRPFVFLRKTTKR